MQDGWWSPRKGIWIPESGKFLLDVQSGIQQIFLVESKIQVFRIRITAQAIWYPTKDWNLESKFHGQRIRNPVSEFRILEVLGIPYMGRLVGTVKTHF